MRAPSSAQGKQRKSIVVITQEAGNAKTEILTIFACITGRMMLQTEQEVQCKDTSNLPFCRKISLRLPSSLFPSLSEYSWIRSPFGHEAQS